MKKIIFLLLALLLPVSAHTQIIKYRINKDNSILITNQISKIYQDISGRIWVSTPQQLLYKESYDATEWLDKTDTIKKHLLLDAGFGPSPIVKAYTMGGDEYGNMIMYNWAGIAISYSGSEEWDFFSSEYDESGSPANSQYKKVTYLNGTKYIAKNKRLYTTGLSDTMYYAQYSEMTNRYHYEDVGGSQYQLLYEGESQATRLIDAGDNLIAYGQNGLAFLDISNYEWTIINDENNLTDFKLDTSLINGEFDTDNGQYWLPESQRLLLLRKISTQESGSLEIFTENQIVDFTFENGKLIKSKVIALDKVLPNSDRLFSTWLDADKDSLLIGNYSEMWIFDVRDNSLSKIPIPDELGDDISQYWAASVAMVLSDKNEIWFGNSNYGLFICDLKALLATATPVGIEEVTYDQYLPILGGEKVYPLPAKGYVNIDFFQQLGSEYDLEIGIYDIKGTKQSNLDVEVMTINGMQKRVKISTSNLPKGIYIAQMKYKEHELSAKFIVE